MKAIHLFRLLFVIGFAVFLTACAAPNPTATSPTDAASEGWQELDDSLVLDESAFARVTPEPVEPVVMSQSEAQAQLPFEFALPAWVPAGFALQDEVEVVQPAGGPGYTSVSLSWLGADEAVLRLRVAQAADDQPALAAAGSTEALMVNGQPATLVHTHRLGSERLALTWPRGELTYTLTAEAGAATPEDLRRMAESVA
jgi:hypothetical protein